MTAETMGHSVKTHPEQRLARFSDRAEIRQPRMVKVSVGYAIRRAQMRIHEALLNTLAELDTTPARYTLMLLIRENPGIRSVDLARAIGVARSGMVRLIDELEQRELVFRETSASDRRNRTLCLTPLGGSKLTQLERAVDRHEARLTEGLEAAERERLLGLLWRIALPASSAPAGAQCSSIGDS